MVSGHIDSGMTAERRAVLREISRQGLVLGETSAQHIGEERLSLPLVQVYFLIYVLGAIEYFGAHYSDDEPLTHGECLAAMAEALDAFENASAEEIRATVLALDNADDDDARRVRDAGAAAARATLEGDAVRASRVFVEMMESPEGLPPSLSPDLQPLARDPGAPARH